jgi:hypothetical protein
VWERTERGSPCGKTTPQTAPRPALRLWGLQAGLGAGGKPAKESVVSLENFGTRLIHRAVARTLPDWIARPLLRLTSARTEPAVHLRPGPDVGVCSGYV